MLGLMTTLYSLCGHMMALQVNFVAPNPHQKICPSLNTTSGTCNTYCGQKQRVLSHGSGWTSLTREKKTSVWSEEVDEGTTLPYPETPLV